MSEAHIDSWKERLGIGITLELEEKRLQCFNGQDGAVMLVGICVALILCS